jgi:hypothetical protein
MQLQTVQRDDVMVVVRDLDDEFRDQIPSEVIAQLAEEAVARFESATVREFVAVLAWRHARFRASQFVQTPALTTASRTPS